MICAENGKYDTAIALLKDVPDYKDSGDKILEFTYKKAVELLNNEYYESAKAILEDLGDYADSRELLENIKNRRNRTLAE